MLASLLLAAAAPVAPQAPVPPITEQPAEKRVQVPSRALPSGSTQPFPSSSRPSLGFLSAGALRQRCESTTAGLASYCFAYITGVHDTVRSYETWLRFREFCPPFTGAQADMRRAFLTYLTAHPDAASGEAASVVVLAFKDQFPCSEPELEKPAAKR